MRTITFKFFQTTITQNNLSQPIAVLGTVYSEAKSEDVFELTDHALDAWSQASLTKSRCEELFLNAASFSLILVKKMVSKARPLVSGFDMHEGATIGSSASSHNDTAERGITIELPQLRRQDCFRSDDLVEKELT